MNLAYLAGPIVRGMRNALRSRARASALVLLLAGVTGFLVLAIQAAFATRQQIATLEARVRTQIELREAGAFGTGGFGGDKPIGEEHFSTDTLERVRRLASARHIVRLDEYVYTPQVDARRKNAYAMLIGLRPGSALAGFRLRAIGFVFQGFNLIPNLSALENVMLPMEFAGVAPKARRERAEQLLARVGLGARLKHRPAELSGGEQQRVAIARALANDPPLVLADEPTGNLDSKTGGMIYELLREVSLERTVLVVTHSETLAQMATRVIHLKDGRLAEES